MYLCIRNVLQLQYSPCPAGVLMILQELIKILALIFYHLSLVNKGVSLPFLYDREHFPFYILVASLVFPLGLKNIGLDCFALVVLNPVYSGFLIFIPAQDSSV